ncbi:hypothetical protein BJ875DRAFT_254764 [Amylocarpus encephaloides]|uniref:Uncharacterized protein n=1 Tax=Amylocarpus encephaloides TaxID=45428 RepID=A0A9P8BYW0_9HELO|nr:hypothetical protein BJ875DRAFT_254764 [Amylocarpus encephaloides]
MASSTAPEPEVPNKKKGGLLSRMKTVMKRIDGSKRLSFSSKALAASTSAAGPSTTKADLPKAREPAPAVGKKVIVTSAKTIEGPAPRKIVRSEIDADRARKLAERFKIQIEPQQWASKQMEKEVYRIEKPIRMRIHRQCHRCQAVFGGNKICPACEHVRCKSCPRYPPKNVEAKGKKNEAPPVADYIEPDNYRSMREPVVLTRPNPRPGCQPLIRKKPMQRVRRTCCECSTLFTPNAKICLSCNHGRCADCPRDPAKKKKYPYGYPGDAPSKDTSVPVVFACHRCMKNFPPAPHPESDQKVPTLECARCGHERCDRCARPLARKVDPDLEPDPEIMKRVEAKLVALNLNIPLEARR